MNFQQPQIAALNAGDPVKAARQPTNGHHNPTGTA